MKCRAIWLIVLLYAAVLGCASKQEALRLDLPQPGSTAQKGVQVILRPPEDRRQFNENLSAPDAPSVNARSDKQAALQARAVGRKRNMYNEPEGELLLDRNDSVSDLASRIAANTLTGMGYAVVEDPIEASPEATAMDIIIEELWLWNRAEAFHNIIQGRLVLYVSLEMSGAPVRIDAAAKRETRIPGRFDWQEVLGNLCAQATQKLQTMLEASPPTPRVPGFSQMERETEEAADTDTNLDSEIDTDTPPAAEPSEETDADTAGTDSNSATAPGATPPAP